MPVISREGETKRNRVLWNVKFNIWYEEKHTFYRLETICYKLYFQSDFFQHEFWNQVENIADSNLLLAAIGSSKNELLAISNGRMFNFPDRKYLSKGFSETQLLKFTKQSNTDDDLRWHVKRTIKIYISVSLTLIIWI